MGLSQKASTKNLFILESYKFLACRSYIKSSLTKCTTHVCRQQKAHYLQKRINLGKDGGHGLTSSYKSIVADNGSQTNSNIPRRLNQSHGLKACMGTQAVGLHFQNKSLCTVDRFLFYINVLLLYLMEFSCIK